MARNNSCIPALSSCIQPNHGVDDMQAAMVSATAEKRSEQSLLARYESLIRLAEAIREHRDPNELFRFLARELRQVVQFDALAQFDEAANKVNWRLCEGCN